MRKQKTDAWRGVGNFFLNTCCCVTRQKYVGDILRGWGETPCYPLPHLLLPVSRLPPSCLHPPPLASRLLSLASCLLSFVSPLHHPLPLYPFPTETLIAGGWEKLTASRRDRRWSTCGDYLPLGGEGLCWPPEVVENDRCEGKGGIWPPAGVCWAGRREFFFIIHFEKGWCVTRNGDDMGKNVKKIPGSTKLWRVPSSG